MNIAHTPAADHASRARLLKERTQATHQRLDQVIMTGDPFASRDRYALFLAVQHQFHRDIDALYDNPALGALLPDLEGRRRFARIEQDLADLGMAASVPQTLPAFGPDADLPTALGWLYVAEGSSLGAAFLLKMAARLGLSEAFGARHLAGAPEGRGLRWRTFTAALDAVSLGGAEQERMVAGAQDAFRRVHDLVRQMFGTPAEKPTAA